MYDDTLPIEAVPFSVPRTAWGKPRKVDMGYFYVNVLYRLTDYAWGELDEELDKIAKAYRGYESGGGTGFGGRDLDLQFFTHIEMLAAVNDIQKRFPRVKITGMHFYRDYRFVDL